MSKASPAAVPQGAPALARAEDILRAADDEILEADQRLAELEAAVEAGDDTIELEHVEAARKQSTWARLRRKGADAKAAHAAAARAEATYDRLVEKVIPRAVVDHSAREQELLDQARELLAELIELNYDRNTAIASIAEYASDPSNFRREEDGLFDHSVDDDPALADFEWHGDRYTFRAPSAVVVRLLRPLKSRIRATSHGVTPQWLTEL